MPWNVPVFDATGKIKDARVGGEGVRAFPGAEGFAANTRGAAGYTGAKSVAIVTNLDNSGAGSLRDAIGGSGKEGTFVTFEVSGIINLTSILLVTSDYTTLCGQTSPGGICLAGYPLQYGNSSNHTEHHILRHVRSRAGSHAGQPDSDAEAFRIWDGSDIMADHCSLSWGHDECTSVTDGGSSGKQNSNITYSYCMITQGLLDPAPEDEHGYGSLISSQDSTGSSMNLHRCFYAHHVRRLPLVQGNWKMQISNCIAYNFDRFYGPTLQFSNNPGQALELNYLSNFVERGPNGDSRAGELNGHSSIGSPYEAIYMLNNFGEKRLVAADNEWCIMDYNTSNLLDTDWQASSEYDFSGLGGEPITVETLNTNKATAKAQALVWLEDCGATKPVRDSHDAAMVTSFDDETDLWLADTTWPTDWPTYSTPSPPADTNRDGISDAWDASNMGGDDWDDEAPSGYLWIEEYVNSLA
jgi:hypothetical protein